jgi:hypothetical protein
MTKPVFAPAFCQSAWIVRDIAAAERFRLAYRQLGRKGYIGYLSREAR